jgi:hypothetical protein
MTQIEMEFVFSRLNISLKDLWRMSYALAKKRTPQKMQDETASQYYRDLGISTLFEFSEQIRLKAQEMTRLAIEEDKSE